MRPNHCYRCILVLVIVAIALVGVARAQAAPEWPRPQGYVSDFANVLSAEWYRRIRSVCQDVETRTGVEMLVVTTHTVAPLASADDYASKLYEHWRIGSAQQERGILLLVSIQEQQAVVVLGRNLLSVVDRNVLDDLSAQILTPMFRTGNYGLSIYQAVVRLAASVDHLPTVRRGSRSTGFWLNAGMAMVIVIILWRFIRPERRHPFQRWRRGEYWGTGQGGFGGNFGGFGGGMGGQGLR